MDRTELLQLEAAKVMKSSERQHKFIQSLPEEYREALELKGFTSIARVLS